MAPDLFPNPVGDPRVRLSDWIVARAGRERPSLTGHRDRAHDDLRVDAVQVFIGKAHPLHHPGREILYHHVHLGHHRQHQLARRRLPQVERDAQFAVVVLHVIGAVRGAPVVAFERLQPGRSRAITLGRHLHLDNFRAHLGQDSAAGRSRHELAEIQHAITLEHLWHVGHE